MTIKHLLTLAAALLGPMMVMSTASASSFYAVGAGNLCIDVAAGIARIGTPVILWDCHGKAPQLFVIDVAQEKIRYRAAPALCVDDIPNQGLALVDCNRTRFGWVFNPKSLRIEGSDGRCWDVAGARYQRGARLIIWRCHAGENQKFVFAVP
jgi:Ricin-type beta-trefoil lectin domain